MRVTAPDGQVIDFPESMDQGQVQAAMQRLYPPKSDGGLLSSVKGVWDDLARGLGKTVVGIPEAISNVSRLGAAKFYRGENVDDPEWKRKNLDWRWTEGVEKRIPTPQGDTPLRQVVRAGLEGAGGALLFPGATPAAGLVNAAAGANAGMASNLAGRFSEGNPLLQALAGVVAGGLTGLGGGLISRPGAASRQLSQAARTIPEEDWGEAAQNLAKFRDAGSQSATLAEAFPGDNALIHLAKQMQSGSAPNPLSQRLAERGPDLQGLGQEALNRVGPAVSAEGTTQRAIAAANQQIKDLERYRTGAWRQAMESSIGIPPEAGALIQRHLLDRAGTTQSRTEQNVFQKFADVLSHPQMGTKTSTQAIASDLKQLQSDLETGANATGGQKISAGISGDAYRAVQDHLKQFDPAYARAEARYGELSRDLVNPAKQGPLGQVAGSNYNNQAPLPSSARLEQLIQDQSPADIGNAGSVNSLPSLAKGAPQDPRLLQDIARTILERRMSKGATNPGQVIRGDQGSLEAQRVAEMVKAGGVEPKHALLPLEVADMLQRLRGQGAAPPLQTNSVAGTIARPFTSLARAANLSHNTAVERQIGQLLADPSPENLAQLRSLAEIDPSFAVVLQKMVQAGVVGGVVGETR